MEDSYCKTLLLTEQSWTGYHDQFCYDHDNECVLYAECDSTLESQESLSEIILE